ncbi:MAG: Uma2 family endonuclease [Anaerolineae bacterium]
MTDAPTKKLTREERMALDAADWMETINGEYQLEDEVGAATFLHLIVIDNVYNLLRPLVRERKLGRVVGDGLTFALGLDDDGKPVEHIPDCAFIRRGRLPKDFDPSQPFPGAPDLAVEVISPGQTVDKLQYKVNNYLKFGSEQVWVIHPILVELHQYRRDMPGYVRVFRNDESVDVEAMFQGLSLNVAQLLIIEEDE